MSEATTPVTEDELKAKASAPRVTKDDVQNNIVAEFYFSPADGVFGAYKLEEMGTYASSANPFGKIGAAEQRDVLGALPNRQDLELLTICVLVLENGFTVHGVSACADPANFNRDIGRRLARQRAENEIWPLMGYELKTRLALPGKGPAAVLEALGFKPIDADDIAELQNIGVLSARN